MVKLHTVAWTMGKQKRVTKELESHTTDNPEPGKYGAPKDVTKREDPKWSLPKDAKLKNLSDAQPGPLDYKIPSLIDEGPKFGMGSRTVYDKNPLLTTTGPGDYDPAKPQTSLSYSIPGRSKGPSDLGMPGPGQYDQDDKSKFIKGAGLGKSPRGKTPKSHKEFSPGPGNYTVEKFAGENVGPKFGFGSDIKDKFYKTVMNSGPGPGFYNEKKVMGDGVPGYSMKGRRKDCRVLPGKDAPCSGLYNPDFSNSRKSAPKFAFSKQHKSKIANIYGKTPSPSHYKPTSSFVKKTAAAWGMGSGKRPALSQVLETPGPGNYNPANSKKEAPSFTGRPTLCVKQSPGPGAYSPDSNNKRKAPQFSMGTEKKNTISARPLNKYTVGPGDYQSSFKKFKSSGPSFGFGTGKRAEFKNESTPGPGSYQIPTKVRNLEGYALPKNKFSYV
mmetsp:Transcript_13805/g.12239  ORF Transcript_13805/g.12239 Transcript_13805/m.12239 type:complete len:442 (-) Transcript_13805:37-1362(-)